MIDIDWHISADHQQLMSVYLHDLTSLTGFYSAWLSEAEMSLTDVSNILPFHNP